MDLRREKMTIAKANKNDEFYTQYKDIEKEIISYIKFNPNVFKNKTILLPCDDPEWSNFTKYFAKNFEKFGIKKLISTSYAKSIGSKQVSMFELNSSNYDKTKHKTHGKIFTLEKDLDGSGKVDYNDLQFEYLQGDGDFRSEEIQSLLHEVDIIITNPPFSLFREFLKWITDNRKDFLIIGNVNCISYKEVFDKIKNNEIWLGNGIGRWISGFIVPKEYDLYGTETKIDDEGNRIISSNNCLWLTNLEHGRRYQQLQLKTMDENLKSSKHKKIRENGYQRYDNYDGIEVPYSDAIPSDYSGVMGVPITFLDKYNPEQFEIIKFRKGDDDKDLRINGKCPYFRILVKNKI